MCKPRYLWVISRRPHQIHSGRRRDHRQRQCLRYRPYDIFCVADGPGSRVNHSDARRRMIVAASHGPDTPPYALVPHA